jgi:hypothetical protein
MPCAAAFFQKQKSAHQNLDAAGLENHKLIFCILSECHPDFDLDLDPDPDLAPIEPEPRTLIPPMSLTPNLRPLPEPERSLSLNRYLIAINQDPCLRDFRALVQSPSDRQLAFIAALERTILVGWPAAVPPKHDDHADLILCDILDLLDGPEFAHHGDAYGLDRHLATLQSLGYWCNREPLTRPSAHELFTTTFSDLTAGPQTTSPSSSAHLSPLLQDSVPDGDLIAHSSLSAGLSSPRNSTLQVTIIPELTTDDPSSPGDPDSANAGRIIHHLPSPSGELSRGAGLQACQSVESSSPDEQEIIPARPVRRGRPPLLDDVAKGRLLGLIAYGLSFRQAAAQLGIHHGTILNMLKRDEQFGQQVAEAQLDALSQPLITVVRASRKSWRAAAWLAKFLDDRQRRMPESTPEERVVG